MLIADVASAFHLNREKRTAPLRRTRIPTLLDTAEGLRPPALRLLTNGEGAVQRGQGRSASSSLHRFHHIQIEGEHPLR